MKDWNITVNIRFIVDFCWLLHGDTLKTVFYVIIFQNATLCMDAIEKNSDRNISIITS